MTFIVRELPRAVGDKECIFGWLYERSKLGAFAWLDAYDSLIERLKRDPESFGNAIESGDCKLSIKEALFKTRRGKVYRVVFYIDEDQNIFILRVRGPGQLPATSEELL